MSETEDLIKKYLDQLTDLENIALKVAREHKIIESDSDIALTNGYIKWLKDQ
tara:strand:- start:157 stop:312 length:156 start_codon:yes stop_codon:yes gene_type:complete